ncbi:hypothetical protein MAAFP003_1234 [Mycobacterium ahvazicum]|uniref:Uncharacterized protein n=1 Tax=Mycobacterium ahvazicum TaxID=1964395 RepID=A0A2K4Y703_9MYCO|nr:hypothetical protein MAAFP003_1234 [Mycobacterium ahvazicum]
MVPLQDYGGHVSELVACQRGRVQFTVSTHAGEDELSVVFERSYGLKVSQCDVVNIVVRQRYSSLL